MIGALVIFKHGSMFHLGRSLRKISLLHFRLGLLLWMPWNHSVLPVTRKSQKCCLILNTNEKKISIFIWKFLFNLKKAKKILLANPITSLCIGRWNSNWLIIPQMAAILISVI